MFSVVGKQNKTFIMYFIYSYCKLPNYFKSTLKNRINTLKSIKLTILSKNPLPLTKEINYFETIKSFRKLRYLMKVIYEVKCRKFAQSFCRVTRWRTDEVQSCQKRGTSTKL